MSKEFAKAKDGDFFLRAGSVGTSDDENDTTIDMDHPSKHQLTNICVKIVDEETEGLIEMMKNPPEYEAEYSNEVIFIPPYDTRSGHIFGSALSLLIAQWNAS